MSSETANKPAIASCDPAPRQANRWDQSSQPLIDHNAEILRLIEGFSGSPDELTYHYVRAAVAALDGNLSAACRQMGIHRRTLQRMLNQSKPKPRVHPNKLPRGNDKRGPRQPQGPTPTEVRGMKAIADYRAAYLAANGKEAPPMAYRRGGWISCKHVTARPSDIEAWTRKLQATIAKRESAQ